MPLSFTYDIRDVLSLGMIPRSLSKITLDYTPVSAANIANQLVLASTLGRPVSSAFHFRSSASIAAQEIGASCSTNRSTFFLPQSTRGTPDDIEHHLFIRQILTIPPVGHVLGYAELQVTPSTWYDFLWFDEFFHTPITWPLDRLPDNPQIFVTDAFSLAQVGVNTHPPIALQPLSNGQAASILAGAGGPNFVRKVRHTQTAAYLSHFYGFSNSFDDSNFTTPDTSNYVILILHKGQIIHFGQTLTEIQLQLPTDQWWIVGPRD